MSKVKECVYFWDNFKQKKLDLTSNEPYDRILEDLHSDDTTIIISCDENKEDIRRLDKLGTLISFVPDMMRIIDMHENTCFFTKKLKSEIIHCMKDSLKYLK